MSAPGTASVNCMLLVISARTFSPSSTRMGGQSVRRVREWATWSPLTTGPSFIRALMITRLRCKSWSVGWREHNLVKHLLLHHPIEVQLISFPFLPLTGIVVSFPGLPQLQFLITCRMQKWRGKAWEQGYRHSVSHIPPPPPSSSLFFRFPLFLSLSTLFPLSSPPPCRFLVLPCCTHVTLAFHSELCLAGYEVTSRTKSLHCTNKLVVLTAEWLP